MEMAKSEISRVVSVLLLGQLVSFLLAVTSFSSSYLARLGVDIPLTQSLGTYLTFALVYGSAFLYRQQKLQVSWYWYLVLAMVDVPGNYLVTQAYQYSSLTSVTLLSCCIIPWVIILTRVILHTHYSLRQYLGAAVCVAGLVLVLHSDTEVPDEGGANPFLGDVLVIIGTFCFALSSVGQEYCVKKSGLFELLAMLGAFGVTVSLFAIPVFERKGLESVKLSPTLVLLLTGFAGASALIFTLAAVIYKMSGDTLFNLSCLTTNMWAVLIRMLVYKQQVNWLYYIAFAVATAGLIIYSSGNTSSSTLAEHAPEEEVAAARYDLLQGEISAHQDA